MDYNGKRSLNGHWETAVWPLKYDGASILASEGGELVQILNTLMLGDLPDTLLKGAIYIHPTLAEGFFSLLDAVKPVD